MVGGMFAGLSLGGRVRSRPGYAFWSVAGGVLATGVVVATIGQALGSLGLAVAGVGLVGGGLTGLKYGAGRVPGVNVHRGDEPQDI